MTLFEKLCLAYAIIVNLYAFSLMRVDKIRAVKDRRHRIPERKLLGVSAAGGALGAFAAMRMFRHKTKHPAFSVGLPVMLVVHIVLVIWAIQ
ncbi:DUF1294 domain-containing protein [Paenibacillus sp. R14(2021)]|uniref:DUF1294 domain-containing protein n=1 Tax=Paenibacillus sp. R14(2021) TaxID=2859228 RepID=UPI002157A1AF|nr:DUF1294 domain-containing protein [Paenibacillus sp. R14(2021)]